MAHFRLHTDYSSPLQERNPKCNASNACSDGANSAAHETLGERRLNSSLFLALQVFLALYFFFRLILGVRRFREECHCGANFPIV